MAKLEATVSPSVTVSARAVRLVNTRIEKKAAITDLQKEVSELDAQILLAAERAGGTMETDDWKVTKVDGENRTIKKELLLTFGVKPSVINKATSVTPFSYAKITVKGGAK